MASTSSAPRSYAIEVRDVSLSFDEKRVLAGVSFRLEYGETLILLGVTGSGKSVLLKLLAGLLKPDSGEIFIEGQEITSLPETQLNVIRKHMGIVFQEGALFDSLSVYENVAYSLRESARMEEEAVEGAVRRMLGFVEMEDAIDKMPSELSGGMRRRVSFARAIVSQPAIMLYDSPTAGLDPVTANTINILIARFRDLQQVSSVLVTQRIQDAFFLSTYVFSPHLRKLVPRGPDGQKPGLPATRFAVLRDGRFYFHGTLEELASTTDPYLLKFIS
ncbi:MAG: ABC transporter ATP-binding protein [Terriglobia bacterium]